VAGFAANSFMTGAHQQFHFTEEGFFGRGTYAGGADKASHFVGHSIVSKELANLYGKFDYSPCQSRWMGFAVSTVV
jgi:hypothetical protein